MRRVFNSALNKFCVIKPAPISIYKRELPIVYIRLNSTEGISGSIQGKLYLKKHYLMGLCSVIFLWLSNLLRKRNQRLVDLQVWLWCWIHWMLILGSSGREYGDGTQKTILISSLKIYWVEVSICNRGPI